MRRMNRMPLLKFFTLTRASAERACLPGALRGRWSRLSLDHPQSALRGALFVSVPIPQPAPPQGERAMHQIAETER